MQLSEAIRLGAMMKPQGFGIGSGDYGATASCALGAAYEASGCGRGRSWERLERMFPVLALTCGVSCPACGNRENPGCCVVPHLNDDHMWTREAIADWVETLEVGATAPAVEQVVEVPQVVHARL